MNVGTLVTILFIGIALSWGFWLIFKRDLMSVNLGKLLSYFVGVILTLIIVLLITVWFLPWWTVRLIEDTRQSENIKVLQNVSQELWNEAISTTPSVYTAVPAPTAAPPVTTPQPTTSPVTTPGTSSSQGVPAAGEHTYTVKSGDTLYSLARNNGVNVDAIKRRNNLTSDQILVGQQLIIPPAATP